MKKTIVLGASPNPTRYAYAAANRLDSHGHEVVPIGIKKGEVIGKQIQKPSEIIDDVDTITMYVGAKNQVDLYDYVLKTNPKRIIFNPGAENPELELLAQKQGIETVEACTLAMLSAGNY